MGAVKSITNSFAANEYLFWYIERQEVDKIIELLTQKPELINCDLTTNYKTTPLHRAALNGHLPLAQLLVEQFKANPDHKTSAGETPLMAAAKRDKPEMVSYLLAAGSNPDVISPTGLTALDYAVLQGNYECAMEVSKKVKVTHLKNPYEYFSISYKYKYRWLDYEIIVDGLEKGVPRESLADFTTKPKRKFADPVVDPREPWKEWIFRNLDMVDPPMVERQDLPEDLQPQNRKFAKLRHFVTRMTISPLTQKPSFMPRVIDEAQSEIKMNEVMSEGTEKMEIKSVA
jgi:hypothetical protein